MQYTRTYYCAPVSSARYIYSLLVGLFLLLCLNTPVSAAKYPYISKHGINFSTGNKHVSQTDISLAGSVSNLSFTRHYNSQSKENFSLGYGWSFSENEHLKIIEGHHLIILTRSDGHMIHFAYNDATDAWINRTDQTSRIVAVADGYKLKFPDSDVTFFDSDGRLLVKRDPNGNTLTCTYSEDTLVSLTDTFGRSLRFLYSPDGKLQTMVTPAGDFIYSYDDNDNLLSVQRPDNTILHYLYEDPNDIHNLTGIVNENNIQTLTVGYNKQDRVVSSAFADGAEQVTIKYLPGYKRIVTNSLGVATTYQLEARHGIALVRSMTGPGCSSCDSDNNTEYVYNSRFQEVQVRDGNGHATLYEYDEHGNRTRMTEAAGSSLARTTSWEYAPGTNRVTTITRPSVSAPGKNTVIAITYDMAGNLLTRTETGFSKSASISRTTTYTYDTHGRVITIDGPRTDTEDITTFSYYPNTLEQGLNRGWLRTVTNALGHTSTLSNYNALGQAELITDPNGVEMYLAYDSRGRLLSKTVDGAATEYRYDPTGELIQVALPEFRLLNYRYDSTGRIEAISDSSGNTINYSYDVEGNRTREEMHDPSGVLRRSLDYLYNQNNKLANILKPEGNSDSFSYDHVGNLTLYVNGEGATTSYIYDALDRLIRQEEPEDISVSYGYDRHDNINSVTDASGHITTFVYDDFQRRIARTSPDTGTTTYTYDSAGNLLSTTDAGDDTTRYEYDSLNRLVAVHYPDSSQNILYEYDQGQNSIGRLSFIRDASGTCRYQYDSGGRVTREERTLDGFRFVTEYRYNDNFELETITYPGGRVISYQRDRGGRITSVISTCQGRTKNLTEGISHLPFGPATTMTLGNGLILNNTYDQQYRLISSSTGTQYDRVYSYLATDNVSSIEDRVKPVSSMDFVYDRTGKLISSTGSYGHLAFSYDKAGNRLTEILNNTETSYEYNSGTNQLAVVVDSEKNLHYTYDPTGNPIQWGEKRLQWNSAGRLSEVTVNGDTVGSYTYDSRSLRTIATTAEGRRYFLYDLQGHLLAETDATGAPVQEYVYLNEQRIALFDYLEDPTFLVQVATTDGDHPANINVYAYDEQDTYTGLFVAGDDAGEAVFNREDFGEGLYRFRADYLGTQTWSPAVVVRQSRGVSILIETETVDVTVIRANAPVAGVKVYLYSQAGEYLGIFALTDSQGKVSFALPEEGGYQFRTDLAGASYWSNPVVVNDGGSSILLDAGGGVLTLTLRNGDEPMPGLETYLFNADGTSLNFSETSDELGSVSYMVPGGVYKVRADYLGYTFFSQPIDMHGDAEIVLNIDHRDVTLTVNGNLDGDINPLASVDLQLLSESGNSLEYTVVTDAQGQASFSLPERPYLVRAIYLEREYFSQPFTWQDTAIMIDQGTATVTVTELGLPRPGTVIRAFTAAGLDTGRSEITDDEGRVRYRLVAGDYRFMAVAEDGNEYWSTPTRILPHQDSPVNISTGGGTFTLQLTDNITAPLADAVTFLYDESGEVFLGQSVSTDPNGRAVYNLADGEYQIAIDYMGYRWWTGTVTIPAMDQLDYVIDHVQVQVSVLRQYNNDIQPLAGTEVSLRTPEGTSSLVSAMTDEQGRAVFSLPEGDYQAEVHYLGTSVNSDIFNRTDTEIVIEEGIGEVHVMEGDTPLAGIEVTVFDKSGTFLNISAVTDEEGIALFRLPSGVYRFVAQLPDVQLQASAALVAHQVSTVDLRQGDRTLSLTLLRDEATPTPLAGVSCSLDDEEETTAVTDQEGKVVFPVEDGTYTITAHYLGGEFSTEPLVVPEVLSTTLLIEHQDVTITVYGEQGEEVEPLSGITCELIRTNGETTENTGLFGTSGDDGTVTFSVPLQQYMLQAEYLRHTFFSEPFDWNDSDFYISLGTLSVQVYAPEGYGEEEGSVQDIPILLYSDSGEYLEVTHYTNEYGEAVFIVPEGEYQFRADYQGSAYWSDSVKVWAGDYREVDIYLDMELSINDEVNNPFPTRYDGPPPVYHAVLASIGSIPSLPTVTSVVATDPSVYYPVSDHIGTSQLIFDDQGNIVWQADTLSFGSLDVNIDLLPDHFRFPGQLFDAETGLHYNWHRYYDPEAGRYISTDPIGLAGGINLYAYVGNDPVNAVDPWGLSALGGVLTGLGGDLMTPEPSDLAWPKWVGWGAAIGGAALVDLMMNEGDDECNSGAQDKYLGKKDEKRLKKKLAEEGETIEDFKTGGKGAGGYDLYVKPNGDIVIKPKGGRGPGEPTGWNISEL